MLNRQKAMRRLIESYGAEAQKDVAIEECAELTKAILKERRYGKTKESRENIIGEIADVKNMIEQLVLIYNCEKEVQDYAELKLIRQMERIENHE